MWQACPKVQGSCLLTEGFNAFAGSFLGACEAAFS